ncbi:MAG: flagellar basal-body MS-ring/collar protein FliF [Kurthia sp.]|uniref:Flagellar M-ring protein n=1 Tax=Kurthia zopfii TaxID=1650 RepID=A0A8B4Q5K9_9BACL|nr:flagellar basal-body MS-ring/collar protein FliF [Kurthia zopfii]PWI21411.1 flagellar M-ring protein FliF [Kurthia zopfii]TDR41766.1 flagellar M-ring protein FliF [Kurthia zopfii]GEK30920.1 flagellar M-ring protein [Kurthia zopfii]STX09077.1 Flagellar M-ring protein [Kurthia zopfii]
MNERMSKMKTDLTSFWQSRSKRQKGTLIGLLTAIIVGAALITYFSTRVTYAPLYSNLTAAEVGQIKEQLDTQGVKSQIDAGGTAISVPKDQVDTLIVNLASQGFPKSGEIDYSFFSQNASFGMTDNEFNVIKMASIQTEIANLMKNIEGVKDAKVMLNLPEQSTFVSERDKNKDASASIVLNTAPGQQFSEEQVRTLYNLVSKSVPNLSTENIVITNQYNEYFDLASGDGSEGNVASAGNQLAVKKQIEKDIQRQVQSLLGNIMGTGKAIVTVTSDIDFTKENREENLVEPVDKENMSGIEISAQKINETYTGANAGATGTPEAESTTDNFTNYQAGSGDGNGDYEKTSDTVNKEVNRIKRQIAESPYRVRDLGIQVVVEPPKADDPTSLEATTQTDIKTMLASIVRTSIDKNSAGQLSDADVEQKVTVSVQKLNGKAEQTTPTSPTIPWWVWVIGGILLVVIALLAFFMIRSRKKDEEEEFEFDEDYEEIDVDDISDEKETEGTVRRKQLEKMAKEKPEDFAKLLRSWISEE